MLLAVLRIPTDSDAITRAATAAGLPIADTRQRLAGTPPRIFLTHGDALHLQGVTQVLNAGGFFAAVVDPAKVPGDAVRLLPERLEFREGRLAVGTAAQVLQEIPVAAIRFIQHGRRDTATHTVSSRELKFSPTKAVLSGGLLLTKMAHKTATVAGAQEHCLLIQRHDGGPEIILYEKKLEYGFLGSAKQPGSLPNLLLTLSRLRAFAPGAGFNAQSLQPGWVAGLSTHGINAQDLAFHLLGMMGA